MSTFHSAALSLVNFNIDDLYDLTHHQLFSSSQEPTYVMASHSVWGFHSERTEKLHYKLSAVVHYRHGFGVWSSFFPLYEFCTTPGVYTS